MDVAAAFRPYSKFLRLSRKVFGCIYLLFCLVGLLWQSSQFTSMYLKYMVSSKIVISFPKKIDPYFPNVCIRYTDILDFERLNRESGRRWSYARDPQVVRKYQHELTVAEIMTMTPRVEDIVKDVSFKIKNSEIITSNRTHSPKTFLEIKKYLFLEYVCYKIIIKSQKSLTFEELAVTTAAPGIIMSIMFMDEEPLSRTHQLKVGFSSEKYYPYRSLTIAPVVWRDYDPKTKTVRSNVFVVHNHLFLTINLPPPYETNCFDYLSLGFVHEVECSQVCLNNRTRDILGKVPYSAVIDDLVDMSIVSYQDMRNETFLSKLNEIQKYCNDKCRKSPCFDKRITTKIRGTQSSHFKVILIVPQQPSICIMSRPKTDMVEFLIYIFSTISTWTGFSIIALNPFCLWNKVVAFKRNNYRDRTNRLTRFSSKHKSGTKHTNVNPILEE